MAHKKWSRTDRPYGAMHMDAVNCGGRVRPVRDGIEWSSWIGVAGKRVLHAMGVVASTSVAKRAAERSCARLGRRHGR